MKVKYKEGYSNFGFAGEEFPADEKGYAELTPEAFAAANEFGIVDSYVPQEAAPDAEPDDDKLFAILEGTIKDIEQEVSGLSVAELQRLKELEDANDNRVGVDTVIRSELASRE